MTNNSTTLIPNLEWLPRVIVSGGQTGADRAALDFAIANGIPHGGWCPKGRLAVDGVLPSKYLLQETESSGYRQRTKRNVLDSDATLIFNMGDLDGGTLQTYRFTQMLRKPCQIVQLETASIDEVSNWLQQHEVTNLNVAGPREEKRSGIYIRTLAFLSDWLASLPKSSLV